MGDVSLFPMTMEDLRENEWPIDQVMVAPEQVIGRTLLKEVKRGEPFLTTDLYLEGDGPDVSKQLKAGYRAVSVQTYVRARRLCQSRRHRGCHFPCHTPTSQ